MSETQGERLKVLRVRAGLKQSEVAEILGCVSQSVSNYESGKSFMNDFQLHTIADWFNVTYEWLKTGDGARTPQEEAERRIAIEAKKIDESTTIVNSEDRARFEDVSDLIKLLPDMSLTKERKRRIYKTLSFYRNELESKVLFGDEEAVLRQATARYGAKK